MIGGVTGGVTGINGIAASASSPAAVGSGRLDQAAFLRLMTAQVAAQDPFKPLDQSQMLAQLAQFSQVAGTAEMNVAIGKLAGLLRDQTALLETIRDRLPASATTTSPTEQGTTP